MLDFRPALSQDRELPYPLAGSRQIRVEFRVVTKLTLHEKGSWQCTLSI